MDGDTPMEGAPLIAPSTTDHALYEDVVAACRSVYDPEIPVNIYDLGLIYTIRDRCGLGCQRGHDADRARAARWPEKCPDGWPKRSNPCPASGP